jgi:hypothetical protein
MLFLVDEMTGVTARPYRRVFILLLGLFGWLGGQTDTKPLKFLPSTWRQYVYAAAREDSSYTRWLTGEFRKMYPQSQRVQIKSLVTSHSLSQVLTHYALLSGGLCDKMGDRFVFMFSRWDEKPASRIEVFQETLPRLQPSAWPVRINLILLEFPLAPAAVQLNRSTSQVRNRLERLYYNGRLREDIASIKAQELGPEADVYVIETTDNFEMVYNHFRSRSGRRIYVVQGRQGDMPARDFELDGTRVLRNNLDGHELIIRVDENPTIVDSQGSSRQFLDRVFIQYIFWHKSTTEPPDSLGS